MYANRRDWEAKLKGARGVARSRERNTSFEAKIGKFFVEYRRKFLFLIPWLSRIDQSFRTDEITSFVRTIAPSETYLREGFLPSKTALICEKTALIFPEYSILLPIGLSGSEPTQKITANSTYWKAKLKGAGGVARSRLKEHLF